VCRATDGSRVAGADAVQATVGAEYKRSDLVATVDVRRRPLAGQCVDGVC
jgi:hypothetical protein